jgi:hypothetical protein
LLSWIGEKYLEWTDEDPPLEKILEVVTLYWMTDTMSRCFYHNRALMSNANDDPKIARISVVTGMDALKKLPYVEKPCGYSMFAQEIVPVPESWAAKSCNLVSFNQHERGGHFAVCETLLRHQNNMLTISRPWNDQRSCWRMSKNTSEWPGPVFVLETGSDLVPPSRRTHQSWPSGFEGTPLGHRRAAKRESTANSFKRKDVKTPPIDKASLGVREIAGWIRETVKPLLNRDS